MNLSYLDFLERLRILELEKALELIRLEKPDSRTFLEIGAGSGWQAKKLSERGNSVEAIDIKESDYLEHRIWPVRDYDGKHIPFPDDHFDVVFSSNVLEHIPHIIEFQKEIQRVLKPDGIAVHLLPSGSWRFWTTMTYYPFWVRFVIRRILSKLFSEKSPPLSGRAENSPETFTTRPLGIRNVLRGLVPHRHGEFGNTLTEIYYFSRTRWVKVFQNTGWKIRNYSTNKLFYSGYQLFGASISTETRGILSTLFGGSCHIFLLSKNDHLKSYVESGNADSGYTA